MPPPCPRPWSHGSVGTARSGVPFFAGRGMSGLTPAPTKRVHDPSGVATHGVPLWSAGDSPFRSTRVMLCLSLRLEQALSASKKKR
jgi:hypothetical protein